MKPNPLLVDPIFVTILSRIRNFAKNYVALSVHYSPYPIDMRVSINSFPPLWLGNPLPAQTAPQPGTEPH